MEIDFNEFDWLCRFPRVPTLCIHTNFEIIVGVYVCVCTYRAGSGLSEVMELFGPV